MIILSGQVREEVLERSRGAANLPLRPRGAAAELEIERAWKLRQVSPSIPRGVERRPGIHAEVLDSRFRGNDGVVARWIATDWISELIH